MPVRVAAERAAFAGSVRFDPDVRERSARVVRDNAPGALLRSRGREHRNGGDDDQHSASALHVGILPGVA